MCKNFSHGCYCFPKLIKQSLPFNAEDFLNLGNDVQVYSGVSNEDILVELIPDDQSDEKEADDYSQN